MKIAIIGSGISGLSAAWSLSKDPSFKVTVYESHHKLGGHTNTMDISSIDGSSTIGVDTGFIVCNPVTYPNFLNLLKELNVNLVQSDMSFSVSRDNGAFEWSGDNLDTVFAQRSNILSFNMWNMLSEILRFHRQALELATEADLGMFDEHGKHKDMMEHPLSKITLGSFFKKENYSEFFYENYILPMTASIWSTPAEMTFDQFPVLTLVRFMRNHVMLQIGNRPKWKTVENASRSYLRAIVPFLKDVRLDTGIVSITRPTSSFEHGKVILKDSKGNDEEFDHVIFATHSDQALAILGDSATQQEKRILGAIKYVKNTAVLHRDESLMPKRKKAWASWNYLSTSKMESRSKSMCLTYWMNRLQPFIKQEEYGNVFVTMNPLVPIDPSKVLATVEYEHPLYSPETIQAQDRLNEIQNKYFVTFAGAWTNYGFHEDGCTSGLLAALSLGATIPFPVELNGGYPTARQAIPPPLALQNRKKDPVKRYKPPSPSKSLSYNKKKDDSLLLRVVIPALLTLGAAWWIYNKF